MSTMSKSRIFQKAATGIFIVFMGLLVLVTVVAHSRPSGSTRQDMAQAQFVRKEAITYKPTPVKGEEADR